MTVAVGSRPRHTGALTLRSPVIMCQKTTLVILLLFTFLYHVHCAKILVIVSQPLRSHYMTFQLLFRELAVRGHSVTVLNNFPDDDPVQNLTFIDLKQYNNSISRISPLSVYEKYDSLYSQWSNLFNHILWKQSYRDDCLTLFTNDEVKALHKRKIKFDVIFVEQFTSDCGLVYAAAMYDAPIIGITSHVLMPISYSRLGIPFDYSADSFYFSKSGPNPSLYGKLESMIMAFVYNVAVKMHIQRAMCEVFEQYLSNNNIIHIERIAQERLKMMFVNQHFSLTGARLLPPQVLEIGGLHIRNTKALPQEIEKFLQTAEHGAILVSFGSNLKANTMSQHKLNEFLAAYKRVPQKILWKYENQTFPAGHENVYFSSWLPQLDILCHPKVLGFVSHGGMLSLSEAAHCGKPVILVPFFGDQFTNAAAARSVGLGKIIYFDKLNADNLAEGMQELASQKMQQTAKRISKLWHDRPASVLDSAIYWTEYVARHGTSPPSLPSKQTTWFQAAHLDVAGVLIILVIFLLALLHVLSKLIKFIARSFCRKLCKVKPKSD